MRVAQALREAQGEDTCSEAPRSAGCSWWRRPRRWEGGRRQGRQGGRRRPRQGARQDRVGGHSPGVHGWSAAASSPHARVSSRANGRGRLHGLPRDGARGGGLPRRRRRSLRGTDRPRSEAAGGGPAGAEGAEGEDPAPERRKDVLRGGLQGPLPHVAVRVHLRGVQGARTHAAAHLRAAGRGRLLPPGARGRGPRLRAGEAPAMPGRRLRAVHEVPRDGPWGVALALPVLRPRAAAAPGGGRAAPVRTLRSPGCLLERWHELLLEISVQ